MRRRLFAGTMLMSRWFLKSTLPTY
jgi:hypothetical protein